MSSEQHHQKKVATSPEVLQAYRAKSAKKLESYKHIYDAVLLARRENQLDDAAFTLTTQLLSINPEFYTIWNYRRRILVQKRTALGDDRQAFQDLCLSDLKLLDGLLPHHPKSYWIWNHRRWVLETMPEPTWDREVKLVSRLLAADPRNFHGWAYRREVVERRNGTPSEELDFTTKKIGENFSNYSAWHHRSNVLMKVYEGEARDQAVHEEFELVRNAIYTEPADQSAWLYQRWLLSLAPEDTDRWTTELASVQELVDLEPDSKWALLTTVHIMKHLARSEDVDAIREALKRLEELDPDRKEYYRDLAK
ncbi:Rab geranylgeranyltransferase [Thoreauomyces humboldtii]|nr:Rab geranylgeranyltransferase [Thoreauomyces humboldtii]